jgi:phosphate-selective porin OprO and OprP
MSLAGNFLTDWQYRVEYEFVGTTGITDAYVAYTAYKPLTFTGGQFKQPLGMEALAQTKASRSWNGVCRSRSSPPARRG